MSRWLPHDNMASADLPAAGSPLPASAPLDIAVISLHTSPWAQPGVDDSGGMNVYVRELAYATAHQGHHSTIYVRQSAAQPAVAPDAAWSEPAAALRTTWVEPGVRVVLVPAGRPDLTKEELPAVVAEFTQQVLQDINQRGGVDVIHSHYWLSGLAGHSLKHELDCPLVANFHTLALAKWGDDDQPERAEAEQAIMDCSDQIVVSCEPEYHQLLDNYEVAPERVSVVTPGVEHAYFAPGDRQAARQALGLGAGPVLLFVGRINPLKNPTLAVETLSELRRLAATQGQSASAAELCQAQLVIVGGPSGPDGQAELQFLQASADSLGVRSQVKLVPPQSHRMLSSYYRAADVVLVPSYSESFGLVALEAAACGTPVVAADVGGLSALVSHGETGFLVPGFGDGTSQNYAKLVAEILSDRQLAARLGRQAAELAGEFNWHKSGQLLAGVYDATLSASLVDCLV